jgi:hypothetical protein
MRHWVVPRFTASGELAKWLHFDQKQLDRGLPDKIRVGDRVLYYLTGTLGGSQSVVGSVEIRGELERVPAGEPSSRGGRDWVYRRAVSPRVPLPVGRTAPGVPLAELRKLLGWKPGATVRQAITIPADRFEAIENALRERLLAAGVIARTAA